MAIAWFVAVTLWTLFVLRTLGGRTALSTGTVAIYGLLGALWGPLVLWLARLFIPDPTWHGAVSLALLWIPVGAILLTGDAWRSYTVADGFALGFAVGFGYDAILELLGIAFRDVARQGLPNMLSFLPPSALQGDWRGVDYAMHGYWLALPTLALVAGLRFLRSRVAAVALAMVCFVFSTVERVGWRGIVAFGFSESTANTIAVIRQNGRLFPWIALVALLALSALEAWWVARACRTGQIIQLMSDWQASVMAFADRDWRKFVGVNSLSRVRRQTELLRAELIHSPKNPSIKKALDASEKRLMLHPDPNNMPMGLFPFHKIYLGLATLAVLTSGLLLFVPFLSESVSNSLWLFLIALPPPFALASSPLPSSDSSPFLTSSGTILLALAAWFYISTNTPRCVGDANPLIRSRAEWWIKVICVALFCLLFVSGIAPDSNYFSNPILYNLNLDYLGNFGLERLYTYIPLLMALGLAAILPQPTIVTSEGFRCSRDTFQRRVLTLIGLVIATLFMAVHGVDQRIDNLALAQAGGEWAPAGARQSALLLATVAKVSIVLSIAVGVRALVVPTLKLIRLLSSAKIPSTHEISPF